MVHELKTDPIPFEAINSKFKTAEVRLNDRGYQVGHLLLLKEYNRTTGKYSGRQVVVLISHILEDSQYGLKEGYVCLSFNFITGLTV